MPEKRISILRELKKGRSHFVFLQETHFKTNKVPKVTNAFFTEAHNATNDSAKSKGVSILISKLSFTLTDRLIVPEGRFVFLKGTYSDKPITLLNVYFPNTAHITFCQRVVHELKGFMSGLPILGEDFNIPLKPAVDSSSGKSCITYRALKAIKTLLNSLQLIDTWRFLHPETRDFTFHSRTIVTGT